MKRNFIKKQIEITTKRSIYVAPVRQVFPVDKIYIKILTEFQSKPQSPVLANIQIEELDLQVNHLLQKDPELKKLEVKFQVKNVSCSSCL